MKNLFAPEDPEPGLVILPLVSVDGRPVPATIRSGNGFTNIVGGYANAMRSPDPSWCNWVIYAGDSEAPVHATGTRAKRTVKAGGTVTFTLDLPGPVFGPGAHTYTFGSVTTQGSAAK